ncbi:conserved hypothetical protein [Beutenbergia cavernae DSM 12333]|uniref:Glycosyl hydrolase 36 catalytic domain-containing protein n=1 Tax=Beutenbergia cavernae (strain ATCC BAA-8 / DSM 12333 / CCUG 43141 / JCM 11478 / NBRC 16432 / NCIMB 13614 / HKI 0122) TaxID=471853 RepID=C5C2X4_BEUC1|nr:hypothetical protein [Beutenbergia cavernae]ACQ81818.1 conserved hypothetical protein [Beutenbergia cavernae DSM 12333]
MTNPPPPWTLDGGRLRAVVADGGAIARLATDDLELVQHAGSALEPGLLGLWVRDARHGLHPLLGPGSGSRVAVSGAGSQAPAAEAQESSRGGAENLSRMEAAGEWDDGGLAWRVRFSLVPGELAWAWDVELWPTDGEPHDVDVVHAHDVALAPAGMLRANELYVSQYLDVTPLEHPTHGWALAVRQNLPVPGGHPWLVLACTDRAAAYATDAIDVHGLAARAAEPPPLAGGLPSRRRQHEHTLAALQTQQHRLDPDGAWRVSFAALLRTDHPAATGEADLAAVEEAIALARGVRGAAGEAPTAPPRPAVASVYAPARVVPVRDLRTAEVAERWGVPERGVETADDGALLAFAPDAERHVVLGAKERAVLRPHGTILRGGHGLAPDPGTVAVTAWMTGSPLSYLTRGHASSARALTTVRGYLGLHRAYGVRVLVEDVTDGGWHLLDVASAFEMTPDGARWVYVTDGVTIELATSLTSDGAVLDVTSSVPRRFLLACHLATSGTDNAPAPGELETRVTPDGASVVFGPATPLGSVAPGARLTLVATENPQAPSSSREASDNVSGTVGAGDDGTLFDDGASRGLPVVTFASGPTTSLRLDARLHTSREVRDPSARGSWPDEETLVAAERGAEAGSSSADAPPAPEPEPAAVVLPSLALPSTADAAAAADVDAVALAVPWLVRDALVHYLAPRGLEQYTGGAWGTRDVSQGPVELLLALDRPDDVRALLRRVFAAQNADGSWPQAFGFLPGDEDFRHEPPHGDVVFWPVLALGRHLVTTGDAGVLDDVVGYHAGARAEESVLEHALRALDAARAATLPGTHLAAYGHGDWNDSLQPAEPGMTSTLTSSWTVTLHHHALQMLTEGLAGAGVHEELADSLRAEAAAVAADARRHLLVDGELAGYAQLAPPEPAGDDGAAATPAHVTRLLVHPRDDETGLTHSALPMIHAIAEDFFTPDEACHHVQILREHLLGTDGMRLFDRPAQYSGGPMVHFQRAESATFVGREIGLMYVHAHLRWCEALARLGDADGLWLALRQVLGGAVAGAVPGARPRQTNTYFSSSDAAVADRPEFAARYGQVRSGEVAVEGGWRIYSSGPGITVRILAEVLLGIRRRGAWIEVDPVLPPELDGLEARVPLLGGELAVTYRVGTRGAGPSEIRLGGRTIEFERLANPYREGGARVDLEPLRDAVTTHETLEIVLP